MSAPAQHALLLVLCLITKVQLETLGFSMGEEPLAQFINRIGRLRSMTALNIVYNSSRTNAADLNVFLTELYTREHSYFAQRPQITSNEGSRMRLQLSNDAAALIITFARDVRDGIINVTSVIARGRRYCYTVFLIDCLRSPQELQQLFAYFWQQQIRRPLVIANRSQLYTMQPYQRALQVLNVTEAPAALYFPPGNVRNYAQYKLRVPVQTDLPQTFIYAWRKHAWRLDGIGGTAFREFMQHVNVSLDAYPLDEHGANFLNMTLLTQLLLAGRIEISPHLYTTLKPEMELEYSYPYTLSRRCLMVPLNNEIPRALYLLLPFQWPVWVSVVGLIVVADLAFRLWLKYVVRSVIRRTFYAHIRSAGVGFSAIRIILAMSEPTFKAWHYRRAPPLALLRLCVLCLALTYLGIFISVSYSTMLTSVMTVTLFREPTTSAEDILKQRMPLMVVHSERHLKYGNETLRNRFRHLLVYAADIEEYHRNRYSLNRAYVYAISELRWRFLDEQQRFLHRKRFWFSNICSGGFPLQYQLQYDSHFYRPLMYYTLAAHEHGLLLRWTRSCFWKASTLGYVNYFKDSQADKDGIIDANVSISLKLLTPVLYLYGVGIVLSCLSFLNEVKYLLITYLKK